MQPNIGRSTKYTHVPSFKSQQFNVAGVAPMTVLSIIRTLMKSQRVSIKLVKVRWIYRTLSITTYYNINLSQENYKWKITFTDYRD